MVGVHFFFSSANVVMHSSPMTDVVQWQYGATWNSTKLTEDAKIRLSMKKRGSAFEFEVNVWGISSLSYCPCLS